MRTKIVALAGGVGGAKLVDGLASSIDPGDLTIIVNTGDDFEHLGLHISPDLDTVCYTLAGIANPDTGWGLRDETWNTLGSLVKLGGPEWFRLGDRDLGTHLERTRLLKTGIPLSEITRGFCRVWGVQSKVLPMSDDPVATWVFTDEGELPFQEYFVRRQCEPRVSGFRYAGLGLAHPAPGVLDSLRNASLVVICPSNPWVSIDPILGVPGVREALQALSARGVPLLAVSPIIGGMAVKGPAAKMYTELGSRPSALVVAEHYKRSLGDGLLAGYVLDGEDVDQISAIEALGVKSLNTRTLMLFSADRLRLAEEILDFSDCMLEKKVFG